MTLEQTKTAAKAGLKLLMGYNIDALVAAYPLPEKYLLLGVGDPAVISTLKANAQDEYTDFASFSTSIEAMETIEAVAAFYKTKISGTGYWDLLKGALEIDLGEEA